MFKDKNGVEFMVGDTILLDRCSDPDTIVSINGGEARVRLPRGSELTYLLGAGDLTIVKRADGSPPRAGDGAEDDPRFAVGAVWFSPKFAVAIVVTDTEPLGTFCYWWHEATITPRADGSREDRAFSDRAYIGNLSDLIAGLQAVHGGAAIRNGECARCGLICFAARDQLCGACRHAIAPPPVAATEPPLTFPLCPRCGERQPGAECGQPACVQARKYVEARKREEGLTEQYAAFRSAAEKAVEGTRVKLVTDMAHTLRRGVMFVAELSIDGMKKTLDYESNAERSFVMASIDIEIDRFVIELGKRAIGGSK